MFSPNLPMGLIVLPGLESEIKKQILPEVEEEDKTGGIILEEIYDHLCKRAPLYSKKENYENFFIALEGQYKFNREWIIPLTSALVRYFENAYDYESDHSLSSFEVKDPLRKIERIMRELDDNSIIETNIETEEINPDLKDIGVAYGNLCDGEPELLKPFPRRGKRREPIDWDEVKDGSEET